MLLGFVRYVGKKVLNISLLLQTVSKACLEAAIISEMITVSLSLFMSSIKICIFFSVIALKYHYLLLQGIKHFIQSNGASFYRRPNMSTSFNFTVIFFSPKEEFIRSFLYSYNFFIRYITLIVQPDFSGLWFWQLD